MIVIVDDSERLWLRVAADAIRSAARRNGLTPPPLAGELDFLATAGHSETSSPDSSEVGDDADVPLLYRREEAAALLAVSPRSVDRLIASGELRAVKVINDRRIARADLVDFVERRRHADGAGVA